MGIVPNPKQHVANLQEIHRRRLRSRPTPASPQQERTTGPAAWSSALTAAQDSRTGGSPEGPPSRCATRQGGGAGPEEREPGDSVGQELGGTLHHRRRLGRDAVPVDAIIGHGERDGLDGGIQTAEHGYRRWWRIDGRWVRARLRWAERRRRAARGEAGRGGAGGGGGTEVEMGSRRKVVRAGLFFSLFSSLYRLY